MGGLKTLHCLSCKVTPPPLSPLLAHSVTASPLSSPYLGPFGHPIFWRPFLPSPTLFSAPAHHVIA